MELGFDYNDPMCRKKKKKIGRTFSKLTLGNAPPRQNCPFAQLQSAWKEWISHQWHAVLFAVHVSVTPGVRPVPRLRGEMFIVRFKVV